ncbi:MAG: DoxX family protein [Leadbetterella sp.]
MTTTVSKSSTVIYWVSTGLTALLMCGSATFYIVKYDMVVKNMEHLSYPPYLTTLLPFTKILGAVLLLFGHKIIPATIWRNLNEWVYAALFCNFVLAAIAHGMAADGWMNPGTIATIILLVSYYFSKKIGI